VVAPIGYGHVYLVGKASAVDYYAGFVFAYLWYVFGKESTLDVFLAYVGEEFAYVL
jgi:hypothetical protein